MKELNLWKFINEKIKEEGNVILFIVADSSNSSPGKQGFKMAITKTGEQYGTVGGGIMEANLIKEVLNNFTNVKDNQIRLLQHDSNTSLEKSGLICGGTQTIIIKRITNKHSDLINEIIERFKKREKCLLFVNSMSLRVKQYSPVTNKIVFNVHNVNDYEYFEIYGLTESAYIIGSGHVGLAVSRIMSILGFYVTIFDHRKDVFTFVNNKFADEKIVCKYSEVGQYIPDGEMTFVIIVTPQHTGDKAALKSIINKDVKYIGMMGSKKKIDTVFQNLEKEGIDNKLFKRVHTPIGLEIEAKTPEEIAISIAAEVIKIKNLSLI